MIGMSASDVLAGEPDPPDGDGVGAIDGAPDALGAIEESVAIALGLDSAVGDADGAATVNVVVPRSPSPSSADQEAQRTVYAPGASVDPKASRSVRFASTAPP